MYTWIPCIKRFSTISAQLDAYRYAFNPAIQYKKGFAHFPATAQPAFPCSDGMYPRRHCSMRNVSGAAAQHV